MNGPRCVGCARVITRGWLFWRDAWGWRLCAYRANGLLPHKPRKGGTP